ncbi:MAG: N-acetylmuramic acid 6-phosphate etherase [Salinarimonas sp.]
MSTERISPRFVDLDAWETGEALEAMLEGQLSAVSAVRAALPAIARAVDAAAARLGEAGRLVYVGAGTSGRIAVQDGAELTPTFDWPRERLVFAIAGGEGALIASAEGAEDDADAAIAAMDAAALGPADVVIGVAASGTTPYTIAGIARARAAGALTIGIASNAGAPLLATAEHAVLIETGGELIAGSTRMKAGTAQKVTLNLISTGVMVRMGRVYRGMMVNMRAANDKLRRRAEIIVSRVAGCDEDVARGALARSEGDIKVAALVALGADPQEARARLAANAGNLRHALADLP